MRWYFSLPVLFAAFLLSACASMQPEQSDYELALIEKKLTELEDKMDEIYHRVSVIQFMVDNHERALSDYQQKGLPAIREEALDREIPEPKEAAAVEPMPAPAEVIAPEPLPQPPPELDQTPQMMYNKALAAYKKSDFENASAAFDAFLAQYPSSDLADNALYWKGECQYAQKNYIGAVQSFTDVVTNYPEGSKVPDALLKAGYSYLAMDDPENGRQYLEKVMQRYPFSPAGTKAEMMLKRLR